MNDIIPIFYACDDIFAKYAIVSIRSLFENTGKTRKYRIHILNTGLSEAHRNELLKMQNQQFSVCFPDVTAFMESVQDRLPIRDYYTKTTYYRLFIAEMFPEYDKAIYIDSDTVVLTDIAELFDHNLGDNYLAASHEQAMVQEEVYGTYVEKVLGIDRHSYFNAGVIVLNCRQFRENHLLAKFLELLGTYNFIVTQDEDYLNVLCRDRVLWLHPGWNAEVFGTLPCPEDEIKIIHYIMVSKPWHYDDCRLQEHFWHYADKMSIAEDIRRERASYTDEQKAEDAASCQRLLQMAREETAREDNYLNRLRRQQALAD